MKNFLKNKILPTLASSFSVQKWIDITQQPLINVFYHGISDSYLPYISPLYNPKPVKDFTEEITFLLKYFQPVDSEEVLLHVSGKKKIDFPAFHLSFDDGLRSVYEVAAPILKNKNIPATIFINSGFVDNKGLFYRYKVALLIDAIYNINPDLLEKADMILKSTGLEDGNVAKRLLRIDYSQITVLDKIAAIFNVDFEAFLKREKPYMNTDELKELKSSGFTIGAHSVDHPYYPNISEHERTRQTVESSDFVIESFGENHHYFSLPFGDSGSDTSIVNDILENVDLVYGISGIKYECSERYIHRIDMEIPAMKPQQRISKAYMTYWLKNL